MSLFKIKLKTKNGNDVKKKHSLTIFLKMHFKKGLKTEAAYTYRIMYSNGIKDPQKVLSIKDSGSVKSMEDLTLKVLLNLCHIVANISAVENFDPDFVVFISPDFNPTKNSSWKYLLDVFKRPKMEQLNADEDHDRWMKIFDQDYKEHWTEEKCKRLGIKKEELDMLKDFSDRNPNVKFMTIDPNRDKQKYAKSITICSLLENRMYDNEVK